MLTPRQMTELYRRASTLGAEERIGTALHETLSVSMGTDGSMFYVIEQAADGSRLLELQAMGWGRERADAHRARYEKLLQQPRQQRIGWYDARSPDGWQMNRALSIRELRRLRPSPAADRWRREAGIGDMDILRVLISDGSGWLGWWGTMRGESFEEVDKRALQQVVPLLTLRMGLERAQRRATSFEAAFARLPRPAVVVDGRGVVQAENPSGRAWHRRDADAARRIRAAVEAFRGNTPSAAGAHALRVEALGCGELYLVVVDPRLERARRWNLTRRERDVLQLVLRGLSTKEIAAHLGGLSPRTVDRHVGSILQKSGYRECRSLIAAFVHD